MVGEGPPACGGGRAKKRKERKKHKTEEGPGNKYGQCKSVESGFAGNDIGTKSSEGGKRTHEKRSTILQAKKKNVSISGYQMSSNNFEKKARRGGLEKKDYTEKKKKSTSNRN